MERKIILLIATFMVLAILVYCLGHLGEWNSDTFGTTTAMISPLIKM